MNDGDNGGDAMNTLLTDFYLRPIDRRVCREWLELCWEMVSPINALALGNDYRNEKKKENGEKKK